MTAMPGVPMFIEVESTRTHKDTRVCSKIVDLLLERKVAPVGLAGTVEETRDILTQARQHGLAPAIFVVNTFGAKAVLPGLFPLIGESPTVYLRRGMYAGKSGLMDRFPEGLHARQRIMWFYGVKNSDDVAKRLAGAVLLFLNDGDFHHIETAHAAGRDR
jgi:hypothetical protein